MSRRTIGQKQRGQAAADGFASTRAAQLSEELIALSPARVYLPVELLPQLDLAPYRGRTEFFALLPRIYRTQDEPILRALLEDGIKKGVTGVSIANLGHLSLVRGLDITLHGDWALNVYNSAALAFWKKEGLASACASFELRDAQLRDLQKSLPCEAIVYGRLPLMITENCLNANESGCRYFQGAARVRPVGRCVRKCAGADGPAR